MAQSPRTTPPTAHTFIKTAAQLEEFAQENQAITWLGFDTEFIQEKRFCPLLCLIQVVTAQGLYILDPTTLKDLGRFLAMLENPQIQKITHAGENDYRLLNTLYGTLPQNLFDTQIAAGFLTHTYPLSFQKLVESRLDIRLDKSAAVTDWQARPMRPQQITYALNDVIHLPALWEQMSAQLAAADRLHWSEEEVAKWSTPEYYAPETRFDLLKRTMGIPLSDKERIFLVRLMEWRRQEAQTRNITMEMVLPKKTMNMVTKLIAQGKAALQQNRLIADRYIKSYGKLWLEMFQTPLDQAEQDLLQRMPQWQEETPEEAISSEFLYLLVRDRCIKAGMAHSLVLSKSAFRSQNKVISQGWRRELLGDSLVRWIQSQQGVEFEVQGDRCVVHFVN